MNIAKDYQEIKDEIIKIRRKIHQYPELSFEEFETAKTICEFLDKYGIEYKSGIAKTGICAYIGDKNSEKAILLRADMDALEFEENTGLEFSSVKKGVMHACGHDVHVANLLAAAYILKKHEAKLKGCVKLVFQPAEETDGGALPMIEEGVLENPAPECCLGVHISPSYPLGELYFKEGPLMASPDDFIVEFVGKSSHGAEPQNGINPIEPAAEFVLGIKSKLEEKIDFTHNVYTVCVLNAGKAYNIIPDKAIVRGTFRSFAEEDRHTSEAITKEYAKMLCEKYHTKCNVTYNYMYPPLINDIEVCKDVKKFAQKEFGKEKVKDFEKPLMTGEDFAYFAKYVPSVFVWAGCEKKGINCGLHSSEFDPDENVIETAARLYAGYAIEYLS